MPYTYNRKGFCSNQNIVIDRRKSDMDYLNADCIFSHNRHLRSVLRTCSNLINFNHFNIHTLLLHPMGLAVDIT